MFRMLYTLQNIFFRLVENYRRVLIFSSFMFVIGLLLISGILSLPGSESDISYPLINSENITLTASAPSQVSSEKSYAMTVRFNLQSNSQINQPMQFRVCAITNTVSFVDDLSNPQPCVSGVVDTSTLISDERFIFEVRGLENGDVQFTVTLSGSISASSDIIIPQNTVAIRSTILQNILSAITLVGGVLGSIAGLYGWIEKISG